MSDFIDAIVNSKISDLLIWIVLVAKDNLFTWQVVLLIVLYNLCVVINRWDKLKIKGDLPLPPGPRGLPLVGYLPYIGIRHMTLSKLAEKYGKIFSVKLGDQLVIALSDHVDIRAVFNSDYVTGRPNTPLMDTIKGYGIVNSEGCLWKSQRRFIMENFRKLGMTHLGNGKQIMGQKIQVEILDLLENLKMTQAAPIDPNPRLAVAVSNVICGITMSKRFTLDDLEFLRMNELIEEGMRLFGELHIGEYMPWVNKFPGKARAQEKIRQNREEMFKFYDKLIEEHKQTLNIDNPRDIIDNYLTEILKINKSDAVNDDNNNNNGDKNSDYKKNMFHDKDPMLQLKQILGDLFSAGMETIKSSLLWMIIFMLRNPDIKKRVQEELDSVVGRDRIPSIDDISYLIYTEATIQETLRMSSIVPLATTHSPTIDYNHKQYKFPKGAQVVPLINHVHMDPNLWDRPEEFNPNRFINESGKIQKPEYFMPFGVGRRMCAGDMLAKTEMTLFFSAIMHQFDVQMEDGMAIPSLEGTVGATIAPKPFRVRFIPRTQPLLPQEVAQEHSLLRNVGAH
uniref:Cytochrome P450 CYP18A1 n=1 Tax=Zygaena filipendulae TaxID=287375 RepID=A0A286MXM9_9NEOP|nr:cytochrome P450 CYP18A1 [Zygaena filipendulae]